MTATTDARQVHFARVGHGLYPMIAMLFVGLLIISTSGPPN